MIKELDQKLKSQNKTERWKLEVGSFPPKLRNQTAMWEIHDWVVPTNPLPNIRSKTQNELLYQGWLDVAELQLPSSLTTGCAVWSSRCCRWCPTTGKNCVGYLWYMKLKWFGWRTWTLFFPMLLTEVAQNCNFSEDTWLRIQLFSLVSRSLEQGLHPAPNSPPPAPPIGSGFFGGGSLGTVLRTVPSCKPKCLCWQNDQKGKMFNSSPGVL